MNPFDILKEVFLTIEDAYLETKNEITGSNPREKRPIDKAIEGREAEYEEEIELYKTYGGD
tara:strand:+ start:1743 stop:1925 length:183 start_codon:yes stop_codon:yes gene_type:complete